MRSQAGDLVVEGAGFQASVQDADESAGQPPQGVMVFDSAVRGARRQRGAGAGRCGHHGIGQAELFLGRRKAARIASVLPTMPWLAGSTSCGSDQLCPGHRHELDLYPGLKAQGSRVLTRRRPPGTDSAGRPTR